MQQALINRLARLTEDLNATLAEIDSARGAVWTSLTTDPDGVNKRDEFTRIAAAEDFATQGRIYLETGLMQLARSVALVHPFKPV